MSQTVSVLASAGALAGATALGLAPVALDAAGADGDAPLEQALTANIAMAPMPRNLLVLTCALLL
jgi:hypothetical protein